MVQKQSDRILAIGLDQIFKMGYSKEKKDSEIKTKSKIQNTKSNLSFYLDQIISVVQNFLVRWGDDTKNILFYLLLFIYYLIYNDP